MSGILVYLESVPLTFPIDISYLIHSVGIKWNVGGCKLEKKNKSDKQIMIFINHIKYYHGHNYTVFLYCFTSVRPSARPRYFLSHFSQQLLMAEI
jgi:hypothetical protein